ncbi:Outer membrane protein (OmpH-like) [Anatilimnocola aggregata]|uniref:Outer membrane protein (OmpH-like) n=1 Tax=Anatilimnocola aggregata TaxID=2528021 RepID=A0A517Y8A8_9BACT|nr:OmpH family outer membrane protein [Anatilimnocola aggregata]QDU26478.1 Outer membrane protein (OmpH-like) [Anatilimnocola aggregata]
MKVCLPATIVAGVVLCAQVAMAQVGAPGAAPAARPPVAPAAAPAGPRTTPTIVVIDIAKVFKGHNRFNQSMGDIKKDIEDFDTFVKGETTKLKAMGEALQQYKAGSLEYKQREEEAARATSDLQVKVGLKKKELLEQEARVYFQVYRELEQSVANFSNVNGIHMVLRFNSDEMKEDDRNSVLQGVNRAVVYYNPTLDVTAHILADLNRFSPPAPTPNPNGQIPSANRPQIPPVGPRR